MNRRQFAGNFAAALAGFVILPSSTLYQRKWKFQCNILYEDLYFWIDEKFQHAAYLHEAPPAVILMRRFIRDRDGFGIQSDFVGGSPCVDTKYCFEDYNRRLQEGLIKSRNLTLGFARLTDKLLLV